MQHGRSVAEENGGRSCPKEALRRVQAKNGGRVQGATAQETGRAGGGPDGDRLRQVPDGLQRPRCLLGPLKLAR